MKTCSYSLQKLMKKSMQYTLQPAIWAPVSIHRYKHTYKHKLRTYKQPIFSFLKQRLLMLQIHPTTISTMASRTLVDKNQTPFSIHSFRRLVIPQIGLKQTTWHFFLLFYTGMQRKNMVLYSSLAVTGSQSSLIFETAQDNELYKWELYKLYSAHWEETKNHKL